MNARATNTQATALGAGNTAAGSLATAVGTAEHGNPNADCSIGSFNNATGSLATAVGTSNAANQTQTVALGNFNNATGSLAVAVGVQNTGEQHAKRGIRQLQPGDRDFGHCASRLLKNP